MYIAFVVQKSHFSLGTITANVEINVGMNNCVFANFGGLKLIAVLKLWNCDVQLFYEHKLQYIAWLYQHWFKLDWNLNVHCMPRMETKQNGNET